eukprot:7787530-Karenia_brevis.AAC.2
MSGHASPVRSDPSLKDSNSLNISIANCLKDFNSSSHPNRACSLKDFNSSRPSISSSPVDP